MNMSRYDGISIALAGYEKTGIPLLAYDGKIFKCPSFGDDEGIFFFVPQIAHMFNLNLDHAIEVFAVGMIMLSLLCGLAGSFLIFKTRAGRVIASIALSLLSLVAYRAGETNFISACVVAAIVPLFIYFVKSHNFGKSSFLFGFLSGIGIGVSNFIRIHSGTGVLIFILVSLLFLRHKWKHRALFIFMLLAGIFVADSYFNMLLNNRDAFLAENTPEFNKSTRYHVVWHAVYCGLGFLTKEIDPVIINETQYSNDVYPEWKDNSAIAKVRSINPDVVVWSKEYEDIIRNETLKFVKNHYNFTIMTMFAKIGILWIYFFVFANFGLIAAVMYHKPCYLEIAFIFALIFTSLPGVLTIPVYGYAMGFIAFATIYGIVSINHALEERNLRKIAICRMPG
jgi:MFS family permease